MLTSYSAHVTTAWIRYGRRTLIVPTGILQVIFAIGCAFADGYSTYTALRFFTAINAAGCYMIGFVMSNLPFESSEYWIRASLCCSHGNDAGPLPQRVGLQFPADVRPGHRVGCSVGLRDPRLARFTNHLRPARHVFALSLLVSASLCLYYVTLKVF